MVDCYAIKILLLIRFNFLDQQDIGRIKMSIDTKMVDIIASQLSVAREKVVPKASFVDDLGADSLDLVELVMAMEEEFDMEIADEDAEKMQTVQDAIDFIKEQGEK